MPHPHPQLSAEGVVVRFSSRLVLDGLDLAASSGDRVALVGENGAGKSTLLRVLAGELVPESGSVRVSGSTALLAQFVDVGAHRTVGDLLSAATSRTDALQTRRGDLEARLERQDDVLAEYGDVLDELERLDAWTVTARLDAAVDGLGLAAVDRCRELATLSGGQRHRLALAALLVDRPDVLLLDEPTTHLDDAAVEFLEREVAGWPGVVVLATHDRAMVDAVATAVVDLDPTLDGGPTRYRGGYADYLDAKAARWRRWQAAFEEWQDEHDRLSALADGRSVTIGHTNRAPRDNDKYAPHFFGQRVDAGVSRRVRDAEQRLDRLVRVPKPPAPLRFSGHLDQSRRTDGVLVQLRDVDVPGRLRLRALDVAHDTRLLVTGANGSGKTTLVLLLAGRLEPVRGSVLRGRGVRVGLLAQDTRWPDPEQTVLSAFAAGREGDVDAQVAALLDVGVLHPRELRTPVGELSVGQQRRVALARLVADAPDVLLLDEPTEHLSLALVEELERALAVRGGPLVVVSHDRWLRRRWSGDELALG